MFRIWCYSWKIVVEMPHTKCKEKNDLSDKEVFFWTVCIFIETFIYNAV